MYSLYISLILIQIHSECKNISKATVKCHSFNWGTFKTEMYACRKLPKRQMFRQCRACAFQLPNVWTQDKYVCLVSSTIVHVLQSRKYALGNEKVTVCTEKMIFTKSLWELGNSASCAAMSQGLWWLFSNRVQKYEIALCKEMRLQHQHWLQRRGELCQGLTCAAFGLVVKLLSSMCVRWSENRVHRCVHVHVRESSFVQNSKQGQAWVFLQLDC